MTTETNRPILLLVDGNAMVHRAYHALQGNTRSAGVQLSVAKTGEPTGAVFGFTQILLKVLGDLKPKYAAVAFDMHGPTFRHVEYEAYKATRAKTADDLVQQFPRVKQLIECFGIRTFEMEGYEADDILGTLSLQATDLGVETVIATGDADTMQLISPSVKVLYPGRTLGEVTLYDEEKVLDRYGVPPKRIADFKGLKGDPSDNIPGVPGVGDKTAAKLLQEYDSVEGIYENIDSVTPPKLRDLLKQYESQARQSKYLATIVRDMPMQLDLEACRLQGYQREQVLELFRELEFTSLMNRLSQIHEYLGGNATGSAPAESTVVSVKPSMDGIAYNLVDSIESLQGLASRLSEVRLIAIDTETNSLNPMEAGLVGISLSAEPNSAYYIPTGHFDGYNLPIKAVKEYLGPVLADSNMLKTAHNANFDLTVLAEHGFGVNGLAFDPMIAAFIIGIKAIGLKNLAFSHLGLEMTQISELIGTGSRQITMDKVPVAQATPYACADAAIAYRLQEGLEADLKKEGLWGLFTDVEMPVVPVLVQMQRNGIAVDTAIMRDMSQDLTARVAQLEDEVYKFAGHRFNVNSTQQLGVVLFEEIGLPHARKTKSGYSTDSAVLEGLKGAHPIIDLVLDYRQLTKLKSTYVDSLPVLINTRTGRIHTSFNQCGSATGRISSNDPNLQNIPIRTEIGRKVRTAFVAGADGTPSYLMSGDYSQVELRILAHLSQDPRLLEAFRNDEDIHAVTAADVFGVDVSQVTPDLRRIAKTVNFGVIYGLSGFGLSQQISGLSHQDANAFIHSYFERYKGIKEYIEDTKKQVRTTGYVQTVMGRRRYVPEVHSANAQSRAAGERMAINMPVQGTAADIIKVAMVRLHNWMMKEGVSSRMLLQIHDELLFEVPQDEVEMMQSVIPEIMSQAIALSVPIRVDVKLGRNWGEME